MKAKTTPFEQNISCTYSHNLPTKWREFFIYNSLRVVPQTIKAAKMPLFLWLSRIQKIKNKKC